MKTKDATFLGADVTLQGKRVLIFEDDRDIEALIGMLLSKEGMGVTNAVDPRSALRSIVMNPPDVIMIDLRMPGFDGTQLLKAIRTANATVPIIAMSGDYTLLGATKGLGATVMLEKPFMSEELLAKVKEALS